MTPRPPFRHVPVLILAAAALASGGPLRAADGPYRLAKSVPLGVQTLQHVFDAQSGRLYATTFSSPRGVVLVDTVHPQRARKIGDAPYGYIDVAPDLNELYILSPVEPRLRVIDLGTKKVTRTYPISPGVGVFYDSSRRELYVFRADNRHVDVLEAQTGRGRATIELEGDPTFVVSDPGLRRVFVRLSKRNAVQVTLATSTLFLNPRTHALATIRPAPSGGGGELTLPATSELLLFEYR